MTELAKLAGEAGLTMIELALAFVLEHPAVTSAIIGPRTMEQLESQLSAPTSVWRRKSSTASTRSSAPGTNVNPEDAGWTPSVLTNPRLRRRHYR